jgi:hypothetical protein
MEAEIDYPASFPALFQRRRYHANANEMITSMILGGSCRRIGSGGNGRSSVISKVEDEAFVVATGSKSFRREEGV